MFHSVLDDIFLSTAKLMLQIYQMCKYKQCLFPICLVNLFVKHLKQNSKQFPLHMVYDHIFFHLTDAGLLWEF